MRRKAAAPTAPAKPKPYIVMTTIQSSSGAWSHEIRTSLVDGTTYCTCPGFFMHGRKCSHMDAWKAHPTFRQGPPINAPHPAPLKRPKRAKKPKAEQLATASTVLVAELARMNLSLTLQQAHGIVKRLTPMILPQPEPARTLDVPSNASIGEHGGARVIIVPD